MKIVYFIDHLRSDGTQHVLKQLTEGLAARGHDQTVVCFNNSWDAVVVNSLRESQISTRFVGKLALVTGYGLLSTWHWLRRERFDVAVTFLFYSDVFGRSLARLSHIPRIISSLRARNIHYRPWQRFLVRYTMPWANWLILNSDSVRDFAVTVEGAAPDHLTVIPNGICINDYQSPISRVTMEKEFGLRPGRRIIGSIGRLTYQKGIDILIEVLARMQASDVDLVVIGTGEEQTRLQAQAQALDLSGRVHFVGYRRDVPRLLGAFDVYVHPARFEGMPNALLEAMAAGCPIVASAVDGNRELIEDGVHGWLVPPEDVDSLAGALIDALCDPATAQRRGAAARRRAIEQFSVDTMVDMWETVLKGQVPVPGQEQ